MQTYGWINRQTDKHAARQAGTCTDKLTSRRTAKKADMLMYGKKNEQADSWKGRWADRRLGGQAGGRANGWLGRQKNDHLGWQTDDQIAMQLERLIDTWTER